LIDKQTAEFRALIKPTKFLRSDGDTYIADGVTLEGIFQLMLLLDGPTAIAFRAANADLFVRHLAGDETLDFERLANSISTDPIKVALRERLLARRAAAAALAAPIIQPISEPVAPAVIAVPISEPVAPAALAAPIIQPISEPVAPAVIAVPFIEPVVEAGVEAMGGPLPRVGERRRREDEDEPWDYEREKAKLDMRTAKLVVDERELTIQKEKIALEEIVRKNRLLDEKQMEIELLKQHNNVPLAPPVPHPPNYAPGLGRMGLLPPPLSNHNDRIRITDVAKDMGIFYSSFDKPEISHYAIEEYKKKYGFPPNKLKDPKYPLGTAFNFYANCDVDVLTKAICKGYNLPIPDKYK